MPLSVLFQVSGPAGGRLHGRHPPLQLGRPVCAGVRHRQRLAGRLGPPLQLQRLDAAPRPPPRTHHVLCRGYAPVLALPRFVCPHMKCVCGGRKTVLTDVQRRTSRCHTFTSLCFLQVRAAAPWPAGICGSSCPSQTTPTLPEHESDGC